MDNLTWNKQVNVQCAKASRLLGSLQMEEVSPRSSPLGDVSRGGTSATQRPKFHTDDAKSVRNPVRRANWSTE